MVGSGLAIVIKFLARRMGRTGGKEKEGMGDRRGIKQDMEVEDGRWDEVANGWIGLGHRIEA